MKLSLDQLRVDSYAVQVSENELADVKGGTTPACIWGAIDVIVAAATVIGAAASVKSCSRTDSGSSSSTVVNETDSTITVTYINGTDTISTTRKVAP